MGNGFDMAIGLNVGCKDYLKIYKTYVYGSSSDDIIKKFVSEILDADDWANWSDLEEGLGRLSTKFDDGHSTPQEQAEHFIMCATHLYNHLNTYLSQLNEIFALNSVLDDAKLKDFINSISLFHEHIMDDNIAQLLKAELVRPQVNFLQLSYTPFLDKLIEKSIELMESDQFSASPHYGDITPFRVGEYLHIHGQATPLSTPVMGVDHPEQILNEHIKNNPNVQNTFIKKNHLDMLKRFRRLPGTQNDQILNIIDESSVICIFGSSIGASDTTLWRRIGEWLNGTGKRLVIFGKSKTAVPGEPPINAALLLGQIEQEKEETIQRFIKYADISPLVIQLNPDKITVELEHKLFDFVLTGNRTNETQPATQDTDLDMNNGTESST